LVSGAAAAAGVSSAGAGVDSIGVSILGASSETLAALPFSGDFERPRALKPEVSRRVRVSFLGVGGLNSASSVAGAAGVSVAAGSTAAGAGVDSDASPFVRGVLSLVSFFGSKPAKMLARLLGFSVLVSVVAGAGVSSVAATGVSSTGAGVVVSTAGAVSMATASSVVSLAAGSGEASFFSALPLNRP